VTEIHPSRSVVAERYRQARGAAKVGIFSNLGLAVLKAVVGLAAGSIALVADAIHSLADLLTSSVVLVGLRIAERPADENHPYGHMRAETLAAVFIAGPLAISGLVMGWSAVRNLGVPRPAPEAAALWTALAAVALKEILYQYKIRVGRRTGSRSVIADAWHHRSDALSSAAVLGGLALTRLDESLWWADPAAALLVCVFVVWAGVSALRGAIGDLMDERPGTMPEDTLRRIIAEHPRVSKVEKILLRRAGLEYSADVHIEVDPELPVREGHEIAHEVIDSIRARMPEVRNVQIHVEPARTPVSSRTPLEPASVSRFPERSE
jgi:cation diffusion facilitator family transporter